MASSPGGRSPPFATPGTVRGGRGVGSLSPPWSTRSLELSGLYGIMPGATPGMSSTGFVGTGGQSAEVLHAFKELKAKAKTLESERKETDRENERLRSELSSSRRESFRFRRGAREMQLSDSLASARNEMEVKRKEVAELERDLIVMEDANRSIERSITSGRARLASMSDDASDLCSLVNAQEQECRVKEEELHKLEERCAYLHSRISALPQAKQQQTNRMKEALATMETELQKIQGAADSGRLRAAGLHRYIEMMIGINGELCDTILAREEAKARVLRISGKLTASPSGLGSTVQPFNDVLATVTKSTAAAAAAAAAASTAAGNGLGGVSTLENEAQQAVREARAVIKMHSKLYSRGRAPPPPPQVVVNATTNGARVSWKQGRGRAVKTKKPATRKKSAGKDLFISGEICAKSRSSSPRNLNVTPVTSHNTQNLTDVDAIAQAAEMFARQASAAANLHDGYGPFQSTTPTAKPHQATNTSHSPSSSPSWRPIEMALSGGSKGSPVFVPSGRPGTDKFNAFASVSKAVRAAKTWNQQIAAAVKSLQHGGADFLNSGPPSFYDKRRVATA